MKNSSIPAIRELTDGNCIGLPTETVYGLAADATNGIAVARIFKTKGRPQFNPLICHVCDLEMAKIHGQFNDLAMRLAEKFWPGPLTLVVPIQPKSCLHPLVTAGLGTVGLRAPKGIAADIIREFGKPLAAPSANRSGKISPTSAAHVRQQFPDIDLFILDTGPCGVGLESTIVKVDGDKLRLLRPGAITAEMIEDASGTMPVTGNNDKVEAPGMMKSHYAPQAQVSLDCVDCPPEAALIKFSDQWPDNMGIVTRNLSETGDLVEAAANLYSCLQELDTHDTDMICVEPIPFQGLGIAINDRLKRAAAPRNEP